MRILETPRPTDLRSSDASTASDRSKPRAAIICPTPLRCRCSRTTSPSASAIRWCSSSWHQRVEGRLSRHRPPRQTDRWVCRAPQRSAVVDFHEAPLRWWASVNAWESRSSANALGHAESWCRPSCTENRRAGLLYDFSVREMHYDRNSHPRFIGEVCPI